MTIGNCQSDTPLRCTATEAGHEVVEDEAETYGNEPEGGSGEKQYSQLANVK